MLLAQRLGYREVRNCTKMEKEGIQTYYRPEWTCGRYNAEHGVAIFYNLIEGMSYLFEDYSAMVIGEILSAGRNGKVSIQEVSQKTNIAVESIAPFFEELVRLNLLTLELPTESGIKDYRTQVSLYRSSQTQNTVKTTKEKLPMEVSSAERDYMDKVGGMASVMFELTYNCSEKCIHCYNIGATRNDTEMSHRGDREELTLSDYYRIIDELYEEGLVKVCLSGGDPFSKPFVWEIISYLYNKGIAFDIFTNGLRIVNDVERLARYYPRLVGVSLYSGDADVHDGITRVKGSWEKSMYVIRQLAEYAITTQIKCCVMRPNVKSYYKIADIAKQYGAVAQFEISITDSIDGDKCASKYLRLTPELMEIVLRDDNVPLYVGEEAPNYGGHPQQMYENVCGAGYNAFCITPEGNLIPCCAFHLVFGNLKKERVGDVYRNSERLKWWKGLTLQSYEDCGKRDYCDYCKICAGNNHSEHGTPLRAGENNCYLAKIRHDLAHKMMNGYDPLQGMTVKERLEDMGVEIPASIQREIIDKQR